MTINPLVAGRIDGPKDAWAGVWLAEDIELIKQGIDNHSWVDGTLGVVGAGLDALALVSDPVGVLLQYGISWIIEHVKPLTEALDWLAGDPGQIAGHAQTWRNVAKSLHESATHLADGATDVTGWQGSAADAYKAWTKQQQDAIEGLAKGAETMASITEGAGYLIAAVRILVRDAIATCVSRLIVYAAEELASFGIGTPLVVEQVTTLIASWAAKIARWLKALIGSLRKLMPIVRRLGEIIEDLKKILNKLRGRKPEEPPKPKEPPKKIAGPKEFDPHELDGLTPDEVRAKIPDDWNHDPSARGGGEVFRDPVNKGRQVRIMPGYPPGSRPDPVTWGPYAVVSQNGQPPVKIPLAGNPTLP
ncbi:WXG100 family type VII secretion target [Hamadaea tsunoensis]|uniref:WXG100 family type VII secretion target n=1 Tax=Hamadaea tsunoensis TaxID=53368 RepID=UPI0003FD77F3|nr:WXG100 family type VII secretion target [Hamadaea tsunoensis]